MSRWDVPPRLGGMNLSLPWVLGVTAIAVVAHVLAWMWRPWLPGVNGYSMLETAQTAVQTMLS